MKTTSKAWTTVFRNSFVALSVIVGVILVSWLLGAKSDESRNTPLPPQVEGVDYLSGLVYGHAGGKDLLLDMARPTSGTGPFPAMVFVHPGGWMSGKRTSFKGEALALAKFGFVCVTIDYRFAPKYRFPAQIEDLKCSVRWLRANAPKYNIDPNRIGAYGHSSGAHLVALLGTTSAEKKWEGTGGNPDQSSAIELMICHAAPTDLVDCAAIARRVDTREAGDGLNLMKFLLGGTVSQIKQAYVDASPINYVNPSTPPTLLLHGTNDDKVPFEQSKVFEAALERAGVEVVFIPIPNGGHDSLGKDSQAIQIKTLEFITRHFKPY